MEGYFESFLKGKKGSVDKIIDFISDHAEKGDHMYSVIKGMIKLPDGYDSIDIEKEIDVEIGMQTDGYGSRNINFFLNDVYFNDLAKIAPDVYIRGNYRLLDNGTIWNYISESGDDAVESYFTYECRYCSKIINEEDLENAISLNDGNMVCSKECFKGFINELLENCNCDDICPNCGEELGEGCFVDDNGYRFCSEECYNEFKEEYDLKKIPPRVNSEEEMSNTGNYFQMFVNKFINASKEQIINIAIDARNDIIKYASECASDSSFATGVLLAGANVGINGNGALNDSQKDLLDAVFAEAYNGSREEMYSDIMRLNSDDLYHILGNCAKLGNSLVIPLLNYILCFPYIGGTLNNEFAKQLESIFAANLIAYYLDENNWTPLTKKVILSDELEIKIINGNYFQMFVNKFINASKDHIINIAIDARNDIIKYASECASDSSFATGVLLAGASVGINGNGALNDSQKDLLDAVFAEAYNGSMEEMYSDIVRHNPDDLYHILGNCAKLGNSLVIPLLNYILCFPYIGGTLNNELAKQLESIFAANLIAYYLDENNWTPLTKKVILSDELEIKIIKWLKIDDKFPPLERIWKHFSDYSHDEVQKALDSLTKKGLIYGGENIFGSPYGLRNEDIEVYDANGKAIEVSDEDALEEILMEFPIIRSIEGTAYSGRINRIEFIKKGDKLILRADYNSKYYSPVAVEVFNTEGETLGFLREDPNLSLRDIALALDYIDARVADVTPLSKRRKNAKYALMDVELSLKGHVIDAAPTVISEDKVKVQGIAENASKNGKINQLISDSIDMSNHYSQVNSYAEESGEACGILIENQPLANIIADHVKNVTFSEMQKELLHDGCFLYYSGEGNICPCKVKDVLDRLTEIFDSGDGELVSIVEDNRSLLERSFNLVYWTRITFDLTDDVEMLLGNMTNDVFNDYKESFLDLDFPKVLNAEQMDKAQLISTPEFSEFMVEQLTDDSLNFRRREEFVYFDGEQRYQAVLEYRTINFPEPLLYEVKYKISGKSTDEAKKESRQFEVVEKKEKGRVIDAAPTIISEDKVRVQDFSESDLKENESEEKKDQSRSKLEEFRINREKEENHVKEIFFSIITGDKKKTIAEMQKENQELRGMSVQRIRSYLRRFVSSGELECMEDIYYMLPETAERIRTEEKKRQKRQEERRRQEEEKKNQEMEVRREYERVKVSLEQAKAGKERAEANIQKLQAEISELEAELEKQNKKLFFKNKAYIEKLNATAPEKRARLKEYQKAREQCSQQLQELEEVLKSKYARFVQEEEENNRREFAKKYPNISEFFRFESEKKKALIKQLLSIMKQNAQKEWRIEELHDATGLPLDDRFTIFRSLDNLAKDGLLEHRKINGSRLYKLCEKADVDALLKTL